MTQPPEKLKARQTNKDATPEPSPCRRYQLTSEGLESLRATARRVKPWTRSTGPKTKTGKQRSRMNALKHGERSAAVLAQSRVAALLARYGQLLGLDRRETK